jgi:hypothetical protein
MAPHRHHRQVKAGAAVVRFFDGALHYPIRPGYRAVDIQVQIHVALGRIRHAQSGGVELQQQSVDLGRGIHRGVPF